MIELPTRPLLESLVTHVDDRGRLTELVHSYNLPRILISDESEPAERYAAQFGQVYTVIDEQAGTIRAFHRHERQVDFFTVVNGKALVYLVDPGGKEAQRHILSDHVLSRLLIPPMWWHGWMSLEPNTILICTINEVYNKQDPDEERVPSCYFDNLNVIWEVLPK